MLKLIFLIIPFLVSFSYGNKIENGKVMLGELEEVLNKHNCFYVGNKDSIYLTFDTGYETGNTTKILDTLKEKNVKAAFFVTGHFMKNNMDLIKRMYDEGHIVGNHTYGHPKINKISKDKLIEEINKLNDLYFEITNSKMPLYFRPPSGEFDDDSLTYLDELGYKTIFWSLAYKDWIKDDIKGEDYAYNSVINKIHDGAIILLHTVSNDNQLALGRIIDKIQELGYNIENIDKLN